MIGIFDSGVGGLTVYREIARQLPQVDILYIGDTAHLPYGEKSKERVIDRAEAIASTLVESGVSGIVVACHTASALALDLLSNLPVPVIGVVEGGVLAAKQASRTGRIGVIATRATIDSGLYQKRLGSDAIAHATPLLVPLVEEAYWDHLATRLILRDSLAPLKEAKVDTLLLACTHYPLLLEAIQEEMGSDVTIVDSASACAAEAERQFGHLRGEGKQTFLATDDPEKFRRLGSLFLRSPLPAVHELAHAPNQQ